MLIRIMRMSDPQCGYVPVKTKASNKDRKEVKLKALERAGWIRQPWRGNTPGKVGGGGSEHRREGTSHL